MSAFLSIIGVVDDEPEALGAMLEALTRRFGGDYRIVPHLSPRAALDALSALKQQGNEIALVISDQWMPEMTGNELLSRVRSIDPTAKRALLVSWGDHAASPTILQACALGEIDNYLYKPWAPADYFRDQRSGSVRRGRWPQRVHEARGLRGGRRRRSYPKRSSVSAGGGRGVPVRWASLARDGHVGSC
jgi:response regulator RpfG family c-di-GMP phosphodiesterase